MLEAECWQVCGEAWVWGQRKMSQVLGMFGLLDFTMLQPVFTWHVFWNLWTVYIFNFSIFFFGPWWTADDWNCGYWIHGYRGLLVFVHCLLCCNCIWSKSGSLNLLEILKCYIGTFTEWNAWTLFKFSSFHTVVLMITIS
jgi:hypothetical protein